MTKEEVVIEELDAGRKNTVITNIEGFIVEIGTKLSRRRKNEDFVGKTLLYSGRKYVSGMFFGPSNKESAEKNVVDTFEFIFELHTKLNGKDIGRTQFTMLNLYNKKPVFCTIEGEDLREFIETEDGKVKKGRMKNGEKNEIILEHSIYKDKKLLIQIRITYELRSRNPSKKAEKKNHHQKKNEKNQNSTKVLAPQENIHGSFQLAPQENMHGSFQNSTNVLAPQLEFWKDLEFSGKEEEADEEEIQLDFMDEKMRDVQENTNSEENESVVLSTTNPKHPIPDEEENTLVEDYSDLLFSYLEIERIE